MKKLSLPSMFIGILIGGILFGGSVAIAANVVASSTTSKVIVNGKEVKIDAYTINSANYFKLRDFAAAVDVGVWYDAVNNTVNVDTSLKYDPNYTGQSASSSNQNNTFTNYVPYGTSSLKTLLYNISMGYVIYKDGQYWATPEFANMISNANVVYFNDISSDNDAINHYGLSDEAVNQALAEMEKWISEDELNGKSATFIYGDTAKSLKRNTGFYSYGSLSGTMGELKYGVPSFDDTLLNEETRTYDGLTISKSNGVLYFRIEDLKKLKIID